VGFLLSWEVALTLILAGESRTEKVGIRVMGGDGRTGVKRGPRWGNIYSGGDCMFRGAIGV